MKNKLKIHIYITIISLNLISALCIIHFMSGSINTYERSIAIEQLKATRIQLGLYLDSLNKADDMINPLIHSAIGNIESDLTQFKDPSKITSKQLLSLAKKYNVLDIHIIGEAFTVKASSDAGEVGYNVYNNTSDRLKLFLDNSWKSSKVSIQRASTSNSGEIINIGYLRPSQANYLIGISIGVTESSFGRDSAHLAKLVFDNFKTFQINSNEDLKKIDVFSFDDVHKLSFVGTKKKSNLSKQELTILTKDKELVRKKKNLISKYVLIKSKSDSDVFAADYIIMIEYTITHAENFRFRFILFVLLVFFTSTVFTIIFLRIVYKRNVLGLLLKSSKCNNDILQKLNFKCIDTKNETYAASLYEQTNLILKELTILIKQRDDLARKVENLSIIKSAYLANMGKGLKKPLDIINGYVTIIENEDLSSEERHDYIEKIKYSSTKLTGLLDKLILYSKLHLKQLSTNSSTFDSHLVIRNLIKHHVASNIITFDNDRFEEITLTTDEYLFRYLANVVVDTIALFNPDNCILINIDHEAYAYRSISFESIGFPQCHHAKIEKHITEGYFEHTQYKFEATVNLKMMLVIAKTLNMDLKFSREIDNTIIKIGFHDDEIK